MTVFIFSLLCLLGVGPLPNAFELENHAPHYIALGAVSCSADVVVGFPAEASGDT